MTEREIQAFVDGELTAERRAAVHAYLAAHPEDAARVAAYQRLNVDLHRQYPLAREPALTLEQAEMAGRLSAAAAARPRRAAGYGLRAAVGAAAVALVAVGGWQGYERFMTPEPPLLTFAERAGEAHRLFTESAGSDAAEEQREEAVENVVGWLSEHADDGSMGTAPDLTTHGFELVRQRIVEATATPTIQLLYRNQERETYLSLIVGTNADTAKTSFSYVEDGGLSLFYWQQGQYAYALSSRLDREALLAIAKTVSAAMLSSEAARTRAAPSAEPGLDPEGDVRSAGLDQTEAGDS